jgi:hypothetical protein
MPSISWRRLHGHNIVAQVDWDPDRSIWRGSIWIGLQATEPVSRLYLHFVSKDSAQAATDHQARRRLKHRCDVSTCGLWLPWWVEDPGASRSTDTAEPSDAAADSRGTGEGTRRPRPSLR